MLVKTNNDYPSSVVVISSTRVVAEQAVGSGSRQDRGDLFVQQSPRFSTHCLHFSLNGQHG